MKSTAGKFALELISIFLIDRTPLDISMAKFFKARKFIGRQDRCDIADFIYGLLRKFQYINWLLQQLVKQDAVFDKARMLMIIYFIIDKNFKNKGLDEIFCGGENKISKLSGYELNFIKKLEEILSKIDTGTVVVPDYAKYNYPEFLDAEMRKIFCDDFENEVKAFSQKACVDLRVNTLKTNRQFLLELLKAKGVDACSTEFSEIGIRILSGRIRNSDEIFESGMAEIQDEGSQMICQFCDVSPGMFVVDFCAGAGGKTLALAAKMQNKGRLVALDIYQRRLENAKKRLRRAGVSNTRCFLVEQKWIKKHEAAVDLVLVDAPCSGCGTWRRNPDMVAKITENDIQEVVAIQKKILVDASKLVKVGGKLVYATCSFLDVENESQIQEFVLKNKNFELENSARFSPYRHHTDGFFVTVLSKKN